MVDRQHQDAENQKKPASRRLDLFTYHAIEAVLVIAALWLILYSFFSKQPFEAHIMFFVTKFTAFAYVPPLMVLFLTLMAPVNRHKYCIFNSLVIIFTILLTVVGVSFATLKFYIKLYDQIIPLLFCGSMVILMTLIVAMWTYKSVSSETEAWNPSGGSTAGMISIMLVLGFINILGTVSFLGARRAPWQSRAKGTLRSIGSSQLAYKDINVEHRYGSFDVLQEHGYIAEGYTPESMVENYLLTWEVNNLSTVSPEGIIELVSTFTVIAYPRDTRQGFLNTFCVTEDQVVRVFVPPPDGDNIFEAIYHWDPIL
jgi:hypothetical protein